ncbi:unnamed protein product, partial [marine sediment metagenome]
TLDKTGKVTIPKKFREWLKIGKIAIILARDSCLYIYPWEKYEGSEKLVKRLSERRFTRLIFPQEAIKEVDKWGRIYIPVGLRKYANIEQRKVVFIGCNEYFEILNEEKRAEGRREEISWRDPLEELRSLEQRRESIEKELEDLDRELEKMIEEPTREHLMVKHQEAIVIIRKIEGLIAELKKLELNIISKF